MSRKLNPGHQCPSSAQCQVHYPICSLHVACTDLTRDLRQRACTPGAEAGGSASHYCRGETPTPPSCSVNGGTRATRNATHHLGFVSQLEQDRAEERDRQSTLRDAMMNLQEEIHTMGLKMVATEEELSRAKAECSMLRWAWSHTPIQTHTAGHRRRKNTSAEHRYVHPPAHSSPNCEKRFYFAL